MLAYKFSLGVALNYGDDERDWASVPFIGIHRLMDIANSIQ